MPRLVQIYPARLPSLPRQAINLAAATARIAGAALAGRSILVSAEVRAVREAACRACRHFTGDRCILCGCCTKGRILDKLKYATEKCPADPPLWES